MFDPFKEYASLVPDAIELLSKVMSITSSLTDLLEAPLHHIRNIQILVDKVVRASVKNMVEQDFIRIVASFQKELTNFCKIVQDTFFIHSEISKTTVYFKICKNFMKL